jgi:hypothetical protein
MCMKLCRTVLPFLLMLAVAKGAETPRSPQQPQPRLRLDPQTRAAATEISDERSSGEPRPSSEVPVMLQRLVVKETIPLPIRRPAVEDPTGSFSPLDGGRLLRRDVGGMRVEVGIWPSIELFEEEARFKPTKTRISFDFLRIKW